MILNNISHCGSLNIIENSLYLERVIDIKPVNEHLLADIFIAKIIPLLLIKDYYE